MGQTIGILGGMGPEATVHLFDLIVKFTKADSDQEHIPIIVFNNDDGMSRKSGPDSSSMNRNSTSVHRAARASETVKHGMLWPAVPPPTKRTRVATAVGRPSHVRTGARD